MPSACLTSGAAAPTAGRTGIDGGLRVFPRLPCWMQAATLTLPLPLSLYPLYSRSLLPPLSLYLFRSPVAPLHLL